MIGPTGFRRGQELAKEHEEAASKPRCAVRGLIRPGAMCSAVIVGGEFCGSSKECQHKLLPNNAITCGVPVLVGDYTAK